MNKFKIETNTKLDESSVAHSGVLDFPKNMQPVEGSFILISGWVLGSDELSPPIRLYVDVDGIEHPIPINTARADVISRVLHKDADSRLHCGFRIEIPPFHVAKLFIEVRGVCVQWKTIIIKSFSDNLQKEIVPEVVEILSEAAKSPNKISMNRINYLESVSESEFNIAFTDSFKVVNHSSFSQYVTSSEKKNSENFFLHFTNMSSLESWVYQASENNEICIPSISGEGLASSNFSIDTDSRINILFFDDPSDPFLVFQHVTFVDAIVMPRRGIIVLFQHISANSAINSLFEAVQWLVKNSKIVSEKRVFGGCISGFGRPYHFFYDCIPALKMVTDSKKIKKKLSLFYSPGSFFIHPDEFIGSISSSSIANPAELRKRSLESGEFYCHIGLPFSNITSVRNDSIDQFIRELATRRHPLNARRDRHKKLRLWWGVTGQKRSWIEQEEGSAYILDQLTADWPDLEVVFDGWTSPIDPGSADKLEIARDEAVVSSIISNMKSKIISSSVIGRTSLEKISIGLTCDAFVANYSTGSMHISRFANRVGVLHMNTRLGTIGHIHHRGVSVPRSRIKDLPDSDMQRADFVSYSIDPDDILFLLRSIIETKNSR